MAPPIDRSSSSCGFGEPQATALVAAVTALSERVEESLNAARANQQIFRGTQQDIEKMYSECNQQGQWLRPLGIAQSIKRYDGAVEQLETASGALDAMVVDVWDEETCQRLDVVMQEAQRSVAKVLAVGKEVQRVFDRALVPQPKFFTCLPFSCHEGKTWCLFTRGEDIGCCAVSKTFGLFRHVRQEGTHAAKRSRRQTSVLL